MRNLLALVGLAVLVFAGVGWYRGWYEIQSATDRDGHRQVEIDIHGNKINDDLHKGTEKLHDTFDGRGKSPSGSNDKPGS